MKYCTQCGHQVGASALFCHRCGAALTIRTEIQGHHAVSPQNHSHQQDNGFPYSNGQQPAYFPNEPVYSVIQEKPPEKRRRKSLPVILTAAVLVIALTTVYLLQPLGLEDIFRNLSEASKPGGANRVTGKNEASKNETSNSTINKNDEFQADGAVGAYSIWPDFHESTFVESSVQKAAVSSDTHKVILGNVAIDFHTWNLNGEDEVVVREFKERTNEDGSLKMKAYDLSLRSGQHAFTSAISVTIPCTAGEDEVSSVILFHSGTGEWEYLNVELSEDGKTFRVDVPHFSAISEIKISKYIGTENDIRSTSGDLTSKGSMYQYKSFSGLNGEFIPMVMRDVYMSDSNFRRLFHSIGTDEVKSLLLQAKLPSQDSVAFALGTLNNAHSLTDSMLLLGQVDSALTAAGKIRLNGTMAGFGGLLTAGRIIYQANKGGDFAAILLENKYNVIESILGGFSYGASYVGLASASTALSAAAAVVFAWSLATGYIDAATELKGMAERGYRFYLDQKQPHFNIADMGVHEYGDFKLGLTGENHARALKIIYDKHADKPKELDAAVSRFYHEYATLYWTSMTDKQRSDHYYEECLGSPLIRPVWEEPSREEIDRMTTKVIGIAVSEGEQILRAFAMDALTRMQAELYKTVKLEVEPYLNERISFTVRDPSQKDGKTFDKSRYASYPISFSGRRASQFAPMFVSLGAYTDDKYAPKARKDSDVVYECTMYHYIQMGCPTKMIFEGNPKEGIPAMTASFQVESGKVVVELKDTPMEGNWEYSETYTEVNKILTDTTSGKAVTIPETDMIGQTYDFTCSVGKQEMDSLVLTWTATASSSRDGIYSSTIYDTNDEKRVPAILEIKGDQVSILPILKDAGLQVESVLITGKLSGEGQMSGSFSKRTVSSVNPDLVFEVKGKWDAKKVDAP